MEIGDAVLRRPGRGALVVQDGERVISAVDPDVDDSDLVLGLPLPGWLVALGEESGRLFWWRCGDVAFRVVDDLPRLSFDGRYDPGGLFRTRFFAAPDSCVVATEECVALLHRDGGLLWTYVHADLTVDVESVGQHAVVLTSEDDRSTLDLATGAFVRSEPLVSWPGLSNDAQTVHPGVTVGALPARGTRVHTAWPL